MTEHPPRGAGALALVVVTTVLAFSALYAPQPLLPVIVDEFGVSKTAAALLTTVCFVPLALAPLFYGLILESFSARRMLRGAVVLLALSEFLFFAAPAFWQLLALRLLQGLLLPAIFTALMTYVSSTASGERVQRAMAVYVASTILGGFLGRATSGAIAAWAGWRFSFLALGITLLAVGFLLGRLPETGGRAALRPGLDQVRGVLRQPGYLRVYLLIFCMFCVFAAVMNFLPFRLTELSGKADEMRIGLMYSGYVMGIVTSLAAVRLCRAFGGEKRALLAACAVFGFALLGLGIPSIPWLFADMFLFCGAMFLVHATSSGLLNRRAESARGLVNGLYVASYYCGGMAGSYLPGFVYQRFGWPGVIVALEVLVACACLLVAGLAGEQRTGANS